MPADAPGLAQKCAQLRGANVGALRRRSSPAALFRVGQNGVRPGACLSSRVS